MNRGYIKLWRRIEDNVSWSRGLAYRGLMVSILVRTCRKNTAFRGVNLKPGQTAVVVSNWCEDLGMDRKGLSKMLKRLSADGFITARSVSNRFTVITVKNWERYQPQTDSLKVTGGKSGIPPEYKSEPRLESELNVQAKSEARIKSKSRSGLEVKSQAEVQPPFEETLQTEFEPKSQSSFESESMAASQLESQSDSRGKTKSDSRLSKSQSSFESESMAASQLGTQSDSQGKSKSDSRLTKSQSSFESESMAASQLESQSDSQGKTKSDCRLKFKADFSSKAQLESQPQVQLKAQLRHEHEPELSGNQNPTPAATEQDIKKYKKKETPPYIPPVQVEASARPETESPQLKSTKQGVGDEAFDVFWAKYPRQQGRRAALREWKRLERKGCLPNLPDILAALEPQLGCAQWSREQGRFVPRAVRWLSEEMWLDVPVSEGGTLDEIDFLKLAEKQRRQA